MEWLHALKDSLEPRSLIEQFGYLGILLVVFAESGLLIGFFLPGDSLLIIAGIMAAAGILKIEILIPLIFLAAFIGDQTGYWMGYRFGRKVFESQKVPFLQPHHIKRSEDFFAKHGQKTIILARFVPIVRTFAPILAGIGSMPYKTFVIYNFIGAVLWGIGVTLAGYLLGNAIPNIEKYLNLIIAVIIILSLLPIYSHMRTERKRSPQKP